jgi:hypothetical protein
MKALQPLRIAHVRLATGDMLGVTRIDQNYLKAASSSNSKIGIQ